MREYLVIFDDSHDYIEMRFDSKHRAGSRKNREDAMETACKRFGGHAINYKIVEIRKLEDD